MRIKGLKDSFYLTSYFCIGVLSVCMSVYYMYALSTKGQMVLPGTGVTDGCQLPEGARIRILPPEEQPLLLTAHLCCTALAPVLCSRLQTWQFSMCIFNRIL